MRFKSHLTGSLILSASFPFLAKEAGINLSFNDLVLIMPAIVLGGNFPDIDTESIPSRIYAVIGLLLTIYWSYTGNYEYIGLIWIPFIAAKIFPHRSWTHNPWFPISIIFFPFIIKIIMHYFNFKQDLINETFHRQAESAFAFGIMCHLILDIKKIKKIVRFIGGQRLVKLLYG